jgi:CRP-like cAMP-binding protein
MPSAPRQVWGDLATTAFVESSLLFRSLDEGARRDLLQLATVATWSPGELVSPEGDDGFYLVLDGTAAVRAAGPSGPVEVAAVERGAFFGASRVLAGGSRAWSLAARSEVTAVAFPTQVIGAVAGRFPKVHRLLEAVLSGREKEAAARLGT